MAVSNLHNFATEKSASYCPDIMRLSPRASAHLPASCRNFEGLQELVNVENEQFQLIIIESTDKKDINID